MPTNTIIATVWFEMRVVECSLDAFIFFERGPARPSRRLRRWATDIRHVLDCRLGDAEREREIDSWREIAIYGHDSRLPYMGIRL